MQDITLQNPFMQLSYAAVSTCVDILGDTLLAFYLHGSALHGDAIVGVSDLDCCLIVAHALDNRQTAALIDTERSLQARYPVASEVHLNVYTIDALQQDSFARFLLRHNAAILYGKNVVDILEAQGYITPRPDAQLAKSRLPFARDCFRDACIGKQPACTGKLPDNPYLQTRKFARYFVVLEGAYWLMTQGIFTTFDKTTVLRDLKKHLPEFCDVFTQTERILQNPLQTTMPPKQFLSHIRPFVERIFSDIERLL